MSRILIDSKKNIGKIKPMHAVNNGPVAKNVRGTSNFELYKAAGIPYARNHDASFYSGYGGEHTVDVHRIFKNFDADENDPKSYLFGPTDKYLANIIEAGTKVFYRLGASIEHGYKYGTYPPADFAKWARICEHIIMHYTKGWADGFEYDIEYWEIWNEPDCRNADGSNPCWQGTEEQFCEFYKVVATHLKKCFPHLKIGGPAFCSPWRDNFKDKFFKVIKDNNVPFDFYSFHRYDVSPYGIYEAAIEASEHLKELGYEKTETVLNEWNYVKGWLGKDWIDTLKDEKGIKGAVFVAAAMSLCQNSPLDMLMYYDARPCTMNGMFKTDYPWECLKGYYPFLMFSNLYKIGNQIEATSDDKDIIVVAAENETDLAVMITYYGENDKNEPKSVEIKFDNNNFDEVKISLLDENHDAEIVKTEKIKNGVLVIDMMPNSVIMIKK